MNAITKKTAAHCAGIILRIAAVFSYYYIVQLSRLLILSVGTGVFISSFLSFKTGYKYFSTVERRGGISFNWFVVGLDALKHLEV